MTLLGFERGEAAAIAPDQVPGRARSPAGARPRARRRRRSADPPATRVGLRPGADHALQRDARADTVPAAGITRARTLRVSKLFWSEYHKLVTELAVDILGAEATGTDRAASFVGVPDRRRRCPQLVQLVGRHVPERPGRHDLRRFVAGAAQHHRRDGARTAEGAAPSSEPMAGITVGMRVAGAVARRPSLWSTALRQARRTDARRLVATPAVPAGAGEGLSRLPRDHSVRRNRSSADSRRCGGLSRMVSGVGPSAAPMKARRALVLNASYEPLSIVSSRRAVCLLLADKAELVEADDGVMRSANLTVPAPDCRAPALHGAGAAPGGGRRVAARRVRPRRVPLPVLRCPRRLDRPRRAAFARWLARVGEPRRRLPAVQHGQARPHARRGRDATAASVPGAARIVVGDARRARACPTRGGRTWLVAG